MTTFTEAFDRLREACDQAHENRENLIRNLQADVAAKAQETTDNLASQSRQRHADFTAMMTELRHNVRTQAQQTRKQLADVAADLRRGGATFNRG